MTVVLWQTCSQTAALSAVTCPSDLSPLTLSYTSRALLPPHTTSPYPSQLSHTDTRHHTLSCLLHCPGQRENVALLSLSFFSFYTSLLPERWNLNMLLVLYLTGRRTMCDQTVLQQISPNWSKKTFFLFVNALVTSRTIYYSTSMWH